MSNNTYLQHHGIKGQKWGVRRFQNADGSLTNSGKKRYNDDGSTKSFKTRRLERSSSKIKSNNAEDINEGNVNKGLSDKQKTAIKVGVAATGTVLATYGAYKASQFLKEKATEQSYKNGKALAEKYLNEAMKLSVYDNERYTNLSKYRNAMAYTNDRTKKVGSSTVEAYKYLRNKDGRADMTVGKDFYDIYVKGHYGDFRNRYRV